MCLTCVLRCVVLCCAVLCVQVTTLPTSPLFSQQWWQGRSQLGLREQLVQLVQELAGRKRRAHQEVPCPASE